MRQATLIYNPQAGSVNLVGPITQVAEYWRSLDWRVTLRPTKAPGHATELAQQARDAGHALVLAAGGDGTLSEVANGLAHSQTALAPLPVGTANSFAGELGLPLPNWLDTQPLLRAAEALAGGRVHWMDLGYRQDKTGNGRYWLLWSGAGLDGFVVDRVEPRPRWSKRLGVVGYALQTLAVAPAFPPLRATVTIDGRTIQDEFLLIVIANCRKYAGFVTLNPTGMLDDGQLELWLFRGRGILPLTRYVLETAATTHIHNEQVEMQRGREIQVLTEPIMACHTDGEHAGKTPFSCRVEPRGLRLLLPNTAPADLFSQPGVVL